MSSFWKLIGLFGVTTLRSYEGVSIIWNYMNNINILIRNDRIAYHIPTITSPGQDLSVPVLCISTSLWVLRTFQKLVEIYFFTFFAHFCKILMHKLQKGDNNEHIFTCSQTLVSTKCWGSTLLFRIK